MRHDLYLEADAFALRPVGLDDASFIANLRSDPQLSKFIHTSSARPEDQAEWIQRYFDRDGDWYFTVVDRVSGAREGTVGIYDYDTTRGVAEWGRWIIRRGSLAAIASALLVYRAGFEALGLRALFCRTVVDNRSVISFHDSSGALRRTVLGDHVEIRGRSYDCVEHYVDEALWRTMRPRLEGLAARLSPLVRRDIGHA
jgi:RimJ/RimL family protein N-acetyltransferase